MPDMAHRTSSRLLFTAFGVSLLAGAGQLGLAFGFGIVRLTGAFTGVSVNQWPAQLVWAGWFATNAAVIGAVLAERLVRHGGQLTGTTRRLAVAGSAALGAMVVAPLCMQPARGAELISVDPVWAVAICAGLGAVIGGGAALAVLVRPPLAWNMAVVAAVVWLLALLSVLPSLGASGPLTPVRLGVLEPAWLSADAAQQLALLILPTVTLLAGAATAALARRRGHPPLVSVPSGVAGPVLVAFAYLAAGPGSASDRYQLTPYYGALIAVVVGALGSAAAALLPWPPDGRATADTAIEPTAILQPLPEVPALPGSASRPTDTESTTTGPAVVVDDRVGAGPATGGARTSADQPIGTTDGSPPHWHWPDARTDAPDDPTTSAFGSAATEESAKRGTAAALAADEPVAADGPVAAMPAADERAEEPGADPSPATTDSAPVGDGSDIRPGVRATQPVDDVPATTSAKAPAPRRTRKPRTPTTSPSPADPPAGADVEAPTEPLPVPSTPVPSTPELSTPASSVPVPSAAATSTPELSTPATLTPVPAAAAPAAAPTPAPEVATSESVEVTPPEVAPRPGHRFPMPDLNRATAWNAFAPAGPRVPQPASEPGPTAATGSAAATDSPATNGPATITSPAGTTTGPAGTASPAGTTTGPESSAADTGTDPARLDGPGPAKPARGLAEAFAATPEVSTDPAATARDVSAAFTKPPAARAEDVQPDSEAERGRRGLFRRGKARSGEAGAAADRDESLLAQDEEYVDWVSGLSRPLDDDEPEPSNEPRRSLRSSGRHHRD
ncbi:hypothetical protein Xph01_48970 [Micromonospora phaseoli]|nr:hypothetical protein Xph01_48970 [Micromonospora phaseoli]